MNTCTRGTGSSVSSPCSPSAAAAASPTISSTYSSESPGLWWYANARVADDPGVLWTPLRSRGTSWAVGGESAAVPLGETCMTIRRLGCTGPPTYVRVSDEVGSRSESDSTDWTSSSTSFLRRQTRWIMSAAFSAVGAGRGTDGSDSGLEDESMSSLRRGRERASPPPSSSSSSPSSDVSVPGGGSSSSSSLPAPDLLARVTFTPMSTSPFSEPGLASTFVIRYTDLIHCLCLCSMIHLSHSGALARVSSSGSTLFLDIRNVPG